MVVKTPANKPAKKIKDLPPSTDLGGLKFRDPQTGTVGYWVSQWGYPEGKAGVFYKTDPKSTKIFPLFLDKLEEALEFEVLEDVKP